MLKRKQHDRLDEWRAQKVTMHVKCRGYVVDRLCDDSAPAVSEEAKQRQIASAD
jgi:hypothetical protein